MNGTEQERPRNQIPSPVMSMLPCTKTTRIMPLSSPPSHTLCAHTLYKTVALSRERLSRQASPVPQSPVSRSCLASSRLVSESPRNGLSDVSCIPHFALNELRPSESFAHPCLRHPHHQPLEREHDTLTSQPSSSSSRTLARKLPTKCTANPPVHCPTLDSGAIPPS